MQAHDEIAGLRRRIDGIDAEVRELKARLAALEAGLAPEPVTPPMPAKPATLFFPPVAEAVSAEPEVSLPVPPVLPPAMPLPEPVAHQETAVPLPSGPASNPLREWLEPLQLWPPSGEVNAEVRLGAWWATRIGALLAVIGIVFLGIYVSRDASPWVRLAEVMAVTAGVIGLGAWLERKLPKFGAVLFGAGLALAYFCAFAAYAVAPMKVISSPAVAAACELLVVAGILAVAWWRGSSVVATMAVALGHVTAFLALRGGASDFGPWVVLVLGVAAVTLRFARGWDAPSAVALPLAWLFLAVAALAGNAELAMPLGAVWFWAALYFLLYLARDWVVALRGGELTRLDRTLQVTNSSLAFAIGLLVTAQVGGTRLTQYYFGSGALMLAATIAWRQVGMRGGLVAIFACKTAGLFALGAISAFEGHARSLVLLAQAFVMLVSARQSAVRGLRVATVLVAAVALGFFVGELRPENSLFVARATLVEAAFLAGAVAFVAALRRWLSFDVAATAFGSVVVGIITISALMTWHARGWEPAVGIGLAVLLAGVAGLLRGSLVAAVVGAMTLLAAHVEMWGLPGGRALPARLWGNELALLAGAAVAGLALRRWDHSGQRRANGALAAIAAATFVVVCFKAFSATAGLAIAAGVAVGLVAIAPWALRWPVAGLSALIFVVGFFLHAVHDRGGNPRWLWAAALLGWSAPAWLAGSARRRETIQDVNWRVWTLPVQTALATGATLLALYYNLHGPARVLSTALAALAVFALTWRPRLSSALEASWVLWAAACVLVGLGRDTAGEWAVFALSWFPALALARPAHFGELAPQPPAWRGAASGIQVTLAAAIGCLVALESHGAARIGAFGGVVAVAFCVWRWAGVAAARTAVMVLAILAWLAAWHLATKSAAQGWGMGLAAVLLTGAAVVLLPFGIERDASAPARRLVRWIGSVAGLALLFFAFVVQRGAVADYATVGWGVAAVTTFLAGLFARSQPHRLVGLAGLALCVPRAFIVDLNSTLHRIAAFVALGVVLLWVGFSYHRFRHLIGDEDKKL